MIQSDAEITDLARQTTELQQALLQCLKDKGPGLLLELAVRVFKFPEDVREPLHRLQTDGLIETQSVSGGQFGGELYVLTAKGERVLRLLHDPTFQRTPKAADTEAESMRREAELLNKLGDTHKEKGDFEKAAEYYNQALKITRELSTRAGESK